MCDFKPGDEVVCVDAGPRWVRHWPFIVTTGLRRGGVYIVQSLVETDDGVGVRLLGVRNTEFVGDRWFTGFRPTRFRKVQRRDLSAWLDTATDFEEPKRAPVKVVP